MNKTDEGPDDVPHDAPGDAPDAGAGRDSENLSGRARVRAFLIEPLTRDGLLRTKGSTVQDHGVFEARLQDRLSYLPEGDLRVLAECVLRQAQGRDHTHWPGFATIWNVAQLICRQPEPDEMRHIMTTWLRSRGGPIARQAGYLVELHSHLRRFSSPPDRRQMDQIRAAAEENARTRRMLSEKRERGLAAPSDCDWLNRYAAATAYCEALVAGGEAAREDAA